MVVTVITWILEGMHGWPVDAVVILSIVLLNGLLSYFQEAKADQAAAALAKMVSAMATTRYSQPLMRSTNGNRQAANRMKV